MKRKLTLIITFLFVDVFSLHAFVVGAKSDVSQWILESTTGRQSLMSKENGANAEDVFVLETSGLIFHSYFKNRLVSSAKLDLGFIERPKFFWTENPDFIHGMGNLHESLNKNLRSVQFDYQLYLPKIGTWFLNFLPFGGFSFVSLANEEFYSSDVFTYFSPSAGIQYFQTINKHFSHTYYFSYSPMLIIEDKTYQHTIHYMNYGAELMITIHPVSVNLFFVARKIYEEFKLRKILGREYTINTTEIGFSFRISLF